jgi:protocatechuate 3,4-dioxygenase beta subunit
VQIGTVIALANDQQVTDISVTLMRSSVITGTVLDVDGQPARGFVVNASYYRRDPTGQRSLATRRTSYTDDRGVYRLYGLPPGSYLVSTRFNWGDAVLLTEADIRHATDQQVRGPAGTAPTPRRRVVGYAPVYFPAATDIAQATSVTLGVAEERTGIDLQAQFAPMARVQGTIARPDGKPAQAIQISAMVGSSAGHFASGANVARTSTDAEGRFTLSGLPPGSYVIDARVFDPPGSTMLWAGGEVLVAGEDQNLSLRLQPALAVSGRVAFDASSRVPPADLSKISVTLTPSTQGFAATGGSARAAANGEFTMTNIAPGRYRLSAALPVPSIESGWFVVSATINGEESLDGPIDIRLGDAVTNAVVTMTDRPTEITGTIVDGAGSPAPEYFIIVFSTSEAHWTPFTRRILQTRPSHDGTFLFQNLPPGEYRIAAVTQVEQGEWLDPSFLTQLVPASVKLTLPEHGKVRQDLRIGASVR